MTHRARFAYAQARLNARHGMRPDARTWRHLDGQRELTAYLQSARRTALRPWVLALSANSGVHEIESTLRRQYRTYVDDVASWQPWRWRASVRWVKRLPDLPILQHLMLGLAAPPGSLTDPSLKTFASANIAVRFQELHASDCRPLVQGWEAGVPLTDAWLQHWRSLWPRTSRSVSNALERLAARFLQHRAALAGKHTDLHANAARSALEHQLTLAFRRNTQQPAAAFIGLALVALDLERLRGQLLLRLLFQAGSEDAS